MVVDGRGVAGGRVGLPGETASAVVFLALPFASCVGGQQLTVYGSLAGRCPLPLPDVPPNVAS
jgi:NAD(P)-dependent dehydrogenase (short-subunit alcohol dehydrogenase family)